MLDRPARTVESRLVRQTEQIINIKKQVNNSLGDIHFHIRLLYAGLLVTLLVMASFW